MMPPPRARDAGRCRADDGDGEIEVQLLGRWAVTTETRRAIGAIPGVVHVELAQAATIAAKKRPAPCRAPGVQCRRKGRVAG